MNVKTKMKRALRATLGLMLVSTAVMPRAHAEVVNLPLEEYTKWESHPLVQNALYEKKDLVKVSAVETSYGEKPVYRAFKEYYERFTYDWKDANGVVHTSNLTDRATDPRQIVELLKKVYTDPLIPGYIEDISYNNATENLYDWYTNQQDRAKKDGSILPDGSWMAHTRGASGTFGNNEVAMRRGDHNIIKYPAQNFYPYFIDKAPDRPLNGATALLVEMKANYYGKSGSNYNNLCEGIKKDENGQYRVNDPVDKALEYIDAVTLITNQRYVEQGEKGFMFNIEGYYAKCFIITKGSPRPDKAYAHKIFDGNVEITSDYHAGYPFYDMFEEFSPANNGPMCDAYAQMNAGERFVVDHNCSSVVMQQHDIMMGAETNYGTRNEKYHVNLMFFLPDMRFADDTAYKTVDIRKAENVLPDYHSKDLGDEKQYPDYVVPSLYSPYTFYAADHQPYIFFNKITAEIDDAVIVNNPKYPGKALVPIKWKSNYKKIIDLNDILESFWIRRVKNGTVDPSNIPLEEIVVRSPQWAGDDADFPTTKEEIGKFTWKYEREGSLIRADSLAVVAWVLEDYEPERDGGKSVSYVIKGSRTESNFNLVESNIVTAVLPFSGEGSYMTIQLNRARSNYSIDTQENVYANTVDYIQVQDANKKAAEAGNLMVNELLAEENYSDGNGVQRNFRVKNGNILIYRRWTDAEGEHNKIIYKLPVNEQSLFMIGTVPVLRLVEEKTIAAEAEAEMGDGVEPYRHLVTLRNNGLRKKGNANEKVADVKAVLVMKWSKPAEGMEVDGKPVAWDPINEGGDGHNLEPNGNLMGYFIDDHDDENTPFKVSTAENVFPTSYTYNIAFKEDDTSHTENTAPLVSNSVEVLVANRNVYAGYIPYTYEEITREPGLSFKNSEDIYDNLLSPNSRGVAVRVSNSALVKNYDVYRLSSKTRDSASKRLVARVWRNDDGSFRPRVFDGSVIIEENEDGQIVYDDASAQDRPASPAGYIGKVPVELAVETNPNDVFALVINSTDRADSPYRENTYGSKFVVMPPPPAVEFTDVKMFWNSDYNYTCSVKVAPVNSNTSPYEVAGYGLWTYEHPKYPEPGVLYPEDCEMTKKCHWLPDLNSYVMKFDVDSKESTMRYDFVHPIAAPTNSNPVVTTNVARMYSVFTDDTNDNCIALEPNDPNNLYVVSDVTAHYGMYGKSGTTGVEDIDTDNNTNYRYFNLNGVEVDATHLSPGVYVRTNGVRSEKITVR